MEIVFGARHDIHFFFSVVLTECPDESFYTIGIQFGESTLIERMCGQQLNEFSEN